jgi:hypothetical protein
MSANRCDWSGRRNFIATVLWYCTLKAEADIQVQQADILASSSELRRSWVNVIMLALSAEFRRWRER